MIRRRDLLLLMFVSTVFTAAPTAGDIGGCGAPVTNLDEPRFLSERKELDCKRCTECGIATERCRRACDPAVPSDIVLPSTCHPLDHDGRVCLRALEAASCDDFASYVDDLAPTTPTECDFCRIPPAPPDGGPQ